MNNPEYLIKKYKLKKHPEGGFYREIYRSETDVYSYIVNNKRSSVTHIYYLLSNGQVSLFHSVKHDEIWHFYAGDSLVLHTFDGKNLNKVVLGENGEYCFTVKAGMWQAAACLGRFSFVGCTVAPGFEFDDFLFAEDCSIKKDILLLNPELSIFFR